MFINTDNELLKKIEITLTYYIKGLVVYENNTSWLDTIQRIVENALLEYTKIDIRKKNFFEISIKDIDEKYIRLELTNKNNKYSKKTRYIYIDIPYTEVINKKNYKLDGKVYIRII